MIRTTIAALAAKSAAAAVAQRQSRRTYPSDAGCRCRGSRTLPPARSPTSSPLPPLREGLHEVAQAPRVLTRGAPLVVDESRVDDEDGRGGRARGAPGRAGQQLLFAEERSAMGGRAQEGREGADTWTILGGHTIQHTTPTGSAIIGGLL